MKITIIAGARPNFMKIAPLMRAINAAKAAGKNISARLVYTGSDEDKSLEPSLFTDLDMPRPDAYLRVDDTDFFQRMAGIVVAFARELEKHPAQIEILSQFNTTFPFYLSNIEIRNLHPVIMLRHILLYLLICGLALSRSDIHLIHIQFHFHMMFCLMKFGQ